MNELNKSILFHIVEKNNKKKKNDDEKGSSSSSGGMKLKLTPKKPLMMISTK